MAHTLLLHIIYVLVTYFIGVVTAIRICRYNFNCKRYVYLTWARDRKPWVYLSLFSWVAVLCLLPHYIESMEAERAKSKSI